MFSRTVRAQQGHLRTLSGASRTGGVVSQRWGINTGSGTNEKNEKQGNTTGLLSFMGGSFRTHVSLTQVTENAQQHSQQGQNRQGGNAGRSGGQRGRYGRGNQNNRGGRGGGGGGGRGAGRGNWGGRGRRREEQSLVQGMREPVEDHIEAALPLSRATKENILALFEVDDGQTWSVQALSNRFGVRKERIVSAIRLLKEERSFVDAGRTVDDSAELFVNSMLGDAGFKHVTGISTSSAPSSSSSNSLGDQANAEGEKIAAMTEYNIYDANEAYLSSNTQQNTDNDDAEASSDSQSDNQAYQHHHDDHLMDLMEPLENRANVPLPESERYRFVITEIGTPGVSHASRVLIRELDGSMRKANALEKKIQFKKFNPPKRASKA
eukprot:TRINITY_DN32052_c0_g1_i1.p1 TRINITY_DN32052_c0_g1~~TRINITY_DN32052_c0_g1_i1.p1  ORF type:complete len:390 (-),score=106.53 TRINITY_DN32052_c0_g1_i1:87-1226(-)